MTLLALTHGINRDGAEAGFVAAARQTHAGMAHLAGSGPAARTCRECRHWQATGAWSAPGGKHGGAPKPAPCRRYQELMVLAMPGPKVPPHTAACKHFIADESPQPALRPQKVFEA